jgi:putative transposase
MIRSFRYPLKPTRAQEVVLTEWLARCCDLYNAGMEQRRQAWGRQRVSIQKFDQFNELPELRKSDPEWAAIPAWVMRSPLERLDNAFRAFFRRCKAGETPGYPRFKPRYSYDSFSFPYKTGVRPIRVENGEIYLPKLGPVKFHAYRELQGDPLVVSVTRTARGWSLAFVCKLGEAPAKVAVKSVVGIDVGLEAFATLSNGERVENPKFFAQSEALIARHQRSISRKRRGSRSRHQAKRQVARAYERISNRRFDFARKLACDLYSRFDLIAHEDLEIQKMARGVFAKPIKDVSWGLFIRCLQSKAEKAGKHCIGVDPRGTSQTCSACGRVEKKGLSEREHRCVCGLTVHRDLNAAVNVLARGLRAELLTEATAEPGRSRVLDLGAHPTRVSGHL